MSLLIAYPLRLGDGRSPFHAAWLTLTPF